MGRQFHSKIRTVECLRHHITLLEVHRHHKVLTVTVTIARVVTIIILTVVVRIVYRPITDIHTIHSSSSNNNNQIRTVHHQLFHNTIRNMVSSSTISSSLIILLLLVHSRQILLEDGHHRLNTNNSNIGHLHKSIPMVDILASNRDNHLLTCSSSNLCTDR
jgi:hypothetical protein